MTHIVSQVHLTRSESMELSLLFDGKSFDRNEEEGGACRAPVAIGQYSGVAWGQSKDSVYIFVGVVAGVQKYLVLF